MSQREKNKEQNRAKIVAAAREIITDEGIDKLTMRYLADKAEVSLRTPYNLFGSKTSVLLALFEGATFAVTKAADPAEGLILENLLGYADQLAAFAEENEIFYRDVFWAIMTSGDQSDRTDKIALQQQLIEAVIVEAVRQGELADDLDTRTFSHHLTNLLAAYLGMWAAGFFSGRATTTQIKYAWCNSFLGHATDAARAQLQCSQADIMTQLAHHRAEAGVPPATAPTV